MEHLLVDKMRRFAASMAGSYDLSAVAYELCDGVSSLLGIEGAALAVTDPEDKLRFVAVTSEDVRRVEEIQEETQTGPCATAFSTQKPVTVSDVRNPDEWPDPNWDRYAAIAEEVGFFAAAGIPLLAGSQRIGALNLYDTKTKEWQEADISVAELFSDMAAAYLAREAELEEARELSAQLQHALDNRLVIEQAKGILAAEYKTSIDEAFRRLREYARSRHIRIADVADGVVNLGLRLPD